MGHSEIMHLGDKRANRTFGSSSRKSRSYGRFADYTIKWLLVVDDCFLVSGDTGVERLHSTLGCYRGSFRLCWSTSIYIRRGAQEFAAFHFSGKEFFTRNKIAVSATAVLSRRPSVGRREKVRCRPSGPFGIIQPGHMSRRGQHP